MCSAPSVMLSRRQLGGDRESLTVHVRRSRHCDPAALLRLCCCANSTAQPLSNLLSPVSIGSSSRIVSGGDLASAKRALHGAVMEI
jgi:hypothetical protein